MGLPNFMLFVFPFYLIGYKYICSEKFLSVDTVVLKAEITKAISF